MFCFITFEHDIQRYRFKKPLPGLLMQISRAFVPVWVYFYLGVISYTIRTQISFCGLLRTTVCNFQYFLVNHCCPLTGLLHDHVDHWIHVKGSQTIYLYKNLNKVSFETIKIAYIKVLLNHSYQHHVLALWNNYKNILFLITSMNIKTPHIQEQL